MDRAPPQSALARPGVPGTAQPDSVGREPGDVLYGADEIAAFLFGDRKHRRRVYTRVARRQLPVFRIGANVCARRSVLLQWIERQERTVREWP